MPKEYDANMSNFSEGSKAKTEVKEKNRVRKEKLAGFIFDLAKLVFAGLVIGSVTPIFTEKFQWINLVFLVTGLYVTYIIASFANKLLK